MAKVIDKASWHVVSGMPEEQAVAHFKFIFEWLDKNKLLSKDGKEILETGIDESVSLNTKMLTFKGADFLKQYYDKYLKSIQYGIKEDKQLLDKYYAEFLKRGLIFAGWTAHGGVGAPLPWG